MNSLQKKALAILILFGVGLTGIAIGFSLAGSKALYGCWPLFGLALLIALMGKKSNKEGEILLDERDILIEKTASGRAFAASYAVFVVGGLGSWLYIASIGKLSTAGLYIIPFLELAGGSVYFIVFGLTVFHLYKKGPCFE